MRNSPKRRRSCKRCTQQQTACDGRKLSCANCLRDEAICSYPRPIRWSRKHEVHNARVSQSPARQVDSLSAVVQIPSTGMDEIKTSAPLNSLGWADLGLDEHDSELAFREVGLIPPESGADTSFSWQGFFGYDAATRSMGTTSEQLNRLDVEQGVETDESGVTAQSYSSNVPISVPARTSAAVGKRAGGIQQVEPCTASTTLLHTFYRMSSSRNTRALNDEDFVRHYFKYVCRLHSCFDSETNMFRRMVADCWTSCPTIYLTIQSMAIAHISNWYPYMGPLGLNKRSQAWRALQRDLQLYRVGCFEVRKALLSLLLLGISASWHFSANLGLHYLYIARNIIQGELRLLNTGRGRDNGEDGSFFAGALIHWEMLASFVDPVPITPFSGHGLPQLQISKPSGQIFPHPWTGVTAEFNFAFAEIGRVLRRHHVISQQTDFDIDLPSRNDDEQWLANMEQFLIESEVPNEEQIADFNDPVTPKRDLIKCAEALRNVSLLEIYRLFPRILEARLSGQAGLKDFPFNIDDGEDDYTQRIDSYTATIAAQTTEILNTMALASAACRFHPVLMLSCAGQLRFPDANSGFANSARYDRIMHCRAVIESRILALSRKLPQAPLLRVMDIINEVWNRLDGGAENTHWIDIIDEKSWQTIMA